METKHTPTPWFVHAFSSGNPVAGEIYSQFTIASCEEHEPVPAHKYIATVHLLGGQNNDEGNVQSAKANAAHIVKCVNLHDDLVTALELALPHVSYGRAGESTMMAVQAALHKARGDHA